MDSPVRTPTADQEAKLAFYVRRSFGSGAIRFSVESRNQPLPAHGDIFNTGPKGEYLRRGVGGLYFAEQTPDEHLTYGEAKFRPPRTPMTPLTVALFVFGGIIAFLGLINAFKNLVPGLIMIIIGGAIAAIPYIMTAKERREMKARYEREKAERAEIDTRNRRIIGEFAELVEEMETHQDPETYERIRIEREERNIPYEYVAPLAKRVLLTIAFEATADIVNDGADSVAKRIDDAAYAAGLSEEDHLGVKSDVYKKYLWHLLADDSLGPRQEELLAEMRRAFRLTPESVEREDRAVEEFRRLRGVGTKSMPTSECPAVQLRFQEVCHERRDATAVKFDKRTWNELKPASLYVTSRRTIVDRTDIPLSQLYDIEVEADHDVLVLTTAKKKFFLHLTDPIYVGGVIFAAQKNFAKMKV